MECPICFDPCDKGIVTPCCHKQFHAECFESCMKVSPTCPLCRTPISYVHQTTRSHTRTFFLALLATASLFAINRLVFFWMND